MIDLAMLGSPFSGLSHRFYHVWQRNRDTYIRLWKSELWPPFVEPALYIIALGSGLGMLVGQVAGMSYLQFIAIGMIATAGMWGASFECLYGSFIRMEFQKTYDAMLATPVSVEDVIAGEILWGVTRGMLSSVGVFTIVAILGLLTFPTALGILVISVFSGFAFACMSFAFTSISPSIYFFNYYVTLILTPMFLFSGVFFPITNLPVWAQQASWILPLTHVVQPARKLAVGQFETAILFDLLWLAIFGAVCFYASLALMKKRLIK